MTASNGKTPLLIDEEEYPEEDNQLVARMRKSVLAGLGLVALSQRTLAGWSEKPGRWYGELAERGESVEKESRQWIDRMVESRKQRARKASDRVESELDKRMEKLADRLNLPRQEDVKDLTAKLNSLNRKLDELKKAQTA